MPASHAPARRSPRRRRAVLVAGLLAVSLAAAGCSGDAETGSTPVDRVAASPAQAPSTSAPPTPDATVTSNLPVKAATPVPVDKTVTLRAEHGTFAKVRVTYGEDHARLAGDLDPEQTTWTSTDRLEPGTKYHVRAVAVNPDGQKTRKRTTFRTEPLTLDQQTYPSIAPLQGETVGVGMPVIVKFDVAVTDKASIEKHLSVESKPAQVGAWHWIDDHEVHWRPKEYWKPGTDVTVHADINSIPAGNGIYGQLSRSVSFHIGDSVIDKINVQTHEMKVLVNGKLARTIPISAGKPGYITRSGIKVIIAKYRHKRMNAATIGISPDSPDYYDLSDVEYAMRVTYSGEFLHAAPWQGSAHGTANVSHGCVGMSTADAAWLYSISKRGDVVDVTGSDRHMTLTNGYGDWNASFREYKKGSALD